MPSSKTKPVVIDEEPLINGIVAHEEIPPARATLPPPRRRDNWWVDMPEEDYPGYKFRIWKNYPSYLLGEIQTGVETRAMKAIQTIVLEHNGWPDQDGNILPQPSEVEFWRQLSNEQVAIIVQLIQTESVKLPNSMRPLRAN